MVGYCRSKELAALKRNRSNTLSSTPGRFVSEALRHTHRQTQLGRDWNGTGTKLVQRLQLSAAGNRSFIAGFGLETRHPRAERAYVERYLPLEN